MSLWQEIYDEVVTLTGRPDLSDETTAAIKTATRRIHLADKFPRDLTSQLVQLPNSAYIVSLDIQSTFPRLRDISNISLCDSEGVPLTTPLIELRELGDIYDPVYKTLVNNIAYLGGTTLNVRSSVPITALLVEYFQIPIVNPVTYNSWIAQLAPDAIIYTAAALVLVNTGNEEKASAFKNLADRQFIPDLVANFSLTEGR